MSYVTDRFDDRIIRILRRGGVGFMPSDTIYGLSCRALDERAVERVHKLKERNPNKPLIVLVSDIKMLDLLSINKKQAKLVEKYWPGALSLEFYAPRSPSWLHRGTKHFAVRSPGKKELRGLIKKVGPIVSTSANLQGREPINNVQEAKKVFGENLDFYVDIGKLKGLPSTIVKVDDGKLRVIREGEVKLNEV